MQSKAKEEKSNLIKNEADIISKEDKKILKEKNYKDSWFFHPDLELKKDPTYEKKPKIVYKILDESSHKTDSN